MSNENIDYINNLITENKQKFIDQKDVDWLYHQISTLSGDRLPKLSDLLKNIVDLKKSDWDSNNLYVSIPTVMLFLFRISDEQLDLICHSFYSFNSNEKYYFLTMVFDQGILDTAGQIISLCL